MAKKQQKQPQPASQPQGATGPSGPPGQQLDMVYVSFSAEINATTTEVLLKACCELATKGVKTIYLLISTQGGSISNGINIYNVLKALPSKVVTHNVGSVDSIGNMVFLAGEDRYASPESTFMFHGVAFNTQNMRFGEKELLERLDSLRADQKKIGSIISSRTKFSSKEVEKLFLQAATKDANFAKDHGIIHEIREAKVPKGVPILQLVFNR